MAIMDAEEEEVNAKAQMPRSWEDYSFKNCHKEKQHQSLNEWRERKQTLKAKRRYIQRPTSRRRNHNQPEMNEAPR